MIEISNYIFAIFFNSDHCRHCDEDSTTFNFYRKVTIGSNIQNPICDLKSWKFEI